MTLVQTQTMPGLMQQMQPQPQWQMPPAGSPWHSSPVKTRTGFHYGASPAPQDPRRGIVSPVHSPPPDGMQMPMQMQMQPMQPMYTGGTPQFAAMAQQQPQPFQVQGHAPAPFRSNSGPSQIVPKNTTPLSADLLRALLEHLSSLLAQINVFNGTPITLVVHGGAAMILHPHLARLGAEMEAKGRLSGGAGFPRRTTTRDIDYISRSFSMDWANRGVHDANERLMQCVRQTAAQFTSRGHSIGEDWMNSDADVALPMETDPATNKIYDPIAQASLTKNNVDVYTLFTSKNGLLRLVGVSPAWAVALKLVRYGENDWADVALILKNGAHVHWTKEMLEGWIFSQCSAMQYQYYDAQKLADLRARIKHAIGMLHKWDPESASGSASVSAASSSTTLVGTGSGSWGTSIKPPTQPPEWGVDGANWTGSPERSDESDASDGESPPKQFQPLNLRGFDDLIRDRDQGRDDSPPYSDDDNQPVTPPPYSQRISASGRRGREEFNRPRAWRDKTERMRGHQQQQRKYGGGGAVGYDSENSEESESSDEDLRYRRGTSLRPPTSGRGHRHRHSSSSESRSPHPSAYYGTRGHGHGHTSSRSQSRHSTPVIPPPLPGAGAGAYGPFIPDYFASTPPQVQLSSGGMMSGSASRSLRKAEKKRDKERERERRSKDGGGWYQDVNGHGNGHVETMPGGLGLDAWSGGSASRPASPEGVNRFIPQSPYDEEDGYEDNARHGFRNSLDWRREPEPESKSQRKERRRMEKAAQAHARELSDISNGVGSFSLDPAHGYARPPPQPYMQEMKKRVKRQPSVQIYANSASSPAPQPPPPASAPTHSHSHSYARNGSGWPTATNAGPVYAAPPPPASAPVHMASYHHNPHAQEGPQYYQRSGRGQSGVLGGGGYDAEALASRSPFKPEMTNFLGLSAD